MKSRPPRRKNDETMRVRIVAPSSPFALGKLEAGVARLRGAGFDVAPIDEVLDDSHAYLNGTDAQRATALSAALADDNCDVVWLARGGYGLTRIVDLLTPVSSTPPVVVGFSDSTALHGLLYRQGFRSVHGPLATTLGDEPDDSFEATLALLRGDRPAPLKLGRLLGDGVVDGPLFCANLCVLTHLIGTRAMPDLSGHLLAVEEIGERPYRVDRMLTQLLSAGALDGVAGVIIGHLSGCNDGPPRGDRPPAPRAIEVVAERLEALSVPVATGLPMGHAQPNHSFAQGAWAALHVSSDGAELRFDQGLYDAPSHAEP